MDNSVHYTLGTPFPILFLHLFKEFVTGCLSEMCFGLCYQILTALNTCHICKSLMLIADVLLFVNI
jgi:hypothetical protein